MVGHNKIEVNPAIRKTHSHNSYQKKDDTMLIRLITIIVT